MVGTQTLSVGARRMPNSPDFDQLTSQEMQQVNDACDQFETAWQTWPPGTIPPSIASALEAFPGTQESQRIQLALCWALVEVDRDARLQRGLSATQSIYEDALPREFHPVFQYIDFDTQPDRCNAVPTETASIRYHVVDKHALGGLGEVFVARDQELGRDVALKKIRSEYADDPEYRNRFLLEAEVTGSLEHPGIVPVYGLGRYEDGRPYYAMRFIKGKSLRDHVDDFHGKPLGDPSSSRSKRDFRSLEFRQLLGRFVDVCNAIEYAHSRGVLHRDLKPSNIMLGEFGETLVVDWGLAKLDAHESGWSHEKGSRIQAGSGSGSTPTQVGTAIGTPAYMSPEQAAGRTAEIGPRSDVYGLGATLYYMLTGQAPFNGNTTDEIIQQVQNGSFKPAREVCPQVPKVLQAICQRAMLRDPGERYPSAKAIGNEIERWLADEPVEVFRDSILTRGFRWVRRHQAMAATMTTASILGIIGAAVLLSVNSAARQSQSLVEEFSKSNLTLIDTLVSKVDSELSTLPNSGQARAQLFIAVKDHLDEMFEKHPDRSMAVHELVSGLVRAGNLLTQIEVDEELLAKMNHSTNGASSSRSTLIRDFYQRAVEVAQQALDASPRDLEATIDYCKALGALADISPMPEQKQRFASIATKLEPLAGRQPNNLDLSRALSKAYGRLGTIAITEGDMKSAAHWCEKTLAVDRKVATAPGAGMPEQLSLVGGLLNHGQFQLQTSQTTAAQESFTEAVSVMESLQRASPDDIRLKQRMAIPLGRLADALETQGLFEEAAVIYRKEIETLESVITADPKSLDGKSTLAEACNNAVSVYLQTDKIQDAIAIATRSKKLSGELKELQPQKLSLVYACATVNLGTALQKNGQFEEAIDEYREARQHLMDLSSLGGNPLIHRHLAVANARIVGLLKRNGKLQDALTLQEQNVREFEELTQDPKNAWAFQDLAISYLQFGEMHTSIDLPKAIGWIEKGIATLEKLVESDPSNASFQQQLANSWFLLGQCQADFKEFSKARQSFHHAVQAIDMLPASSSTDQDRAGFVKASILELTVRELRTQNNLPAAAEAAVDLARHPSANSQHHYLAAECFADAANSDAVDTPSVHWTEMALSSLRAAVAAGFDDVERLTKDPRFEVVRKEPAFKEVVESLRYHQEQK